MFKKSKAVVIAVCSLGMLSASVAHAESSDMQLKEVVVTATKTVKYAQDVTQSVTVITADEIRRSSATTVAEVLKTAPGVDIKSYGSNGSVSYANMRGANYQQVLVLLDGMRMNSAASGGFDLSSLPIPLNNIERIEIVRGPGSALYGADAVGGVVNIITKKPTTTSVGINSTLGAEGYTLLGGSISGRPSAVYYNLNAAKERSHGYRANSDHDQMTLGGKLGYDLGSSSSLELSSNYLTKKLGVPGSTTYPSDLARQWTRETVTGLRYKQKVSTEMDANVNVYETQERIAYKNPDPLNTEDSRSRGITTGTEAQVNWLFNSWNLLSIGAEAKKDRLTGIDTGAHNASLTAAYLQDELSMGEAAILVVGARNDSHSVYGDKLSPKASLRLYDSNTKTILRASTGKSFRAPTLNDLYWGTGSNSTTAFAVGNPALRPESADEYEIGLEQSLGGKSSMKLTKFDRKVKDMIDWETNGSVYTPTNIDRAHIYGYEAEAKLAFSESFQVNLNYTHTVPINEVTGERIYYTIPNIQIGGNVQLVVGKDTTISFDGKKVKNYVKTDEEKWSYFTVDGKISEKLGSDKGFSSEIFVGMKNMFNRKYEVVKGYPMSPQEFYGGIALLF